MDANWNHHLRSRESSTRSIRVHWRSFAVDLNSCIQSRMGSAGASPSHFDQIMSFLSERVWPARAPSTAREGACAPSF